MKTMLSAMISKAKTAGPVKLNAVASQVLPEVATNMNSSDMMTLLFQLATYKSGDKAGWPFTPAPWMHNGIWYGPPNTLKSNVIKLHEKYFGQPGYTPTQTVLDYSRKISEQTGYY